MCLCVSVSMQAETYPSLGVLLGMRVAAGIWVVSVPPLPSVRHFRAIIPFVLVFSLSLVVRYRFRKSSTSIFLTHILPTL